MLFRISESSSHFISNRKKKQNKMLMFPEGKNSKHKCLRDQLLRNMVAFSLYLLHVVYVFTSVFHLPTTWNLFRYIDVER